MSTDTEVTIFDFISSDAYLTANKKLAKCLGLNEAVMYGELLSRYKYFRDRGRLKDGYFFNTVEDFEDGTTLSRYQQDKAIKKLKRLKLIHYKVKGVPPKRYFTVNENIDDLLLVLNNLQETYKLKLQETEKLKREKLTSSYNKTKGNKTKNKTKSIGVVAEQQPKEFDFDVLERQIKKQYANALISMPLSDVISIFRYFTDRMNEYGFKIWNMKNETVLNIINGLDYADIDGEDIPLEADDYYTMIDKYFESGYPKAKKRSLAHLMGVRKGLYYKGVYAQ